MKKKKKVGENNGQLRLVRNHGWHTQARLDQQANQFSKKPLLEHIIEVS